MPNRLRNLGAGALVAFTVFGAPPAFAAPKTKAAAEPAPAAADVTAVKSKLQLFTDGKQHYFAFVPFGSIEDDFFFGDGKTFYQQRIFGGGSNGTESFEKYFWEPRARVPAGAAFLFTDKKYDLQCEDRHTAFTPVAADEAQKLIAQASFLKPRWMRQAYALARDNLGRYYYVDRMRAPEGNKSFRLFVGAKGSMKLQKMTNVVSDSAGDIFATRTGELRLVLNAGQTFWMKGKKKTNLINLPVEDNHVLIYSELGVYTGQPLGTPCDDL